MKNIYKAWDKEEKRMITDVFINYNQCYSFYEAEDDNGDLQWYGGLEEDWIPLQCTGRKDKDGEDIYESDILKKDNDIRLVKWFEEKAKFVLARIIFGEENKIIEEQPIDEKDYKIIGNVFENKELLNNK